MRRHRARTRGQLVFWSLMPILPPWVGLFSWPQPPEDLTVRIMMVAGALIYTGVILAMGRPWEFRHQRGDE